MSRRALSITLGCLALMGLAFWLILAPDRTTLQAQWARKANYFSPDLRTQPFHCGGDTRDGPAVSDFEIEWYGKFLIAADEPSLYQASLQPGAVVHRTWRLTFLPSFRKPIFVRLDRQPGGQLELNAIRLSGKGGYEPGVVEARVHRLLTGEEQRRFERALASAGNLALPPIDCSTGSDGARWIVEANDAGTYRYVNRWSPDDGPVRELGEVFLQLTGWAHD